MLHGYLPMILEGLRVTLSVAAVSLAIACVFGLAGGGRQAVAPSPRALDRRRLHDADPRASRPAC